jgi:pterin-4a-carbinolamine dehydratase
MPAFTFYISYDRQQMAPIALLLKQALEQRLKFVRVIVDLDLDLDLDTGSPGAQPPERVRQLIDQAHATIALIGRHVPALAGGDGSAGTQDELIVNEVAYARAAALTWAPDARFGLTERRIVALYADCPPEHSRLVLQEQGAPVESLSAEQISFAGWAREIGPLIDRIAIGVGLKKRPDGDVYPAPDPAQANTQPVNDGELARVVRYDDYEGWYVDHAGVAGARCLNKVFKFRNFDQAAAFMAMVSGHCKVMDHHPEWRNVYNMVSVSLTTWDAQRRVTLLDLALALYMNKAAQTIMKSTAA